MLIQYTLLCMHQKQTDKDAHYLKLEKTMTINYNSPLIQSFAIQGFSFPWSAAVGKYQMENSRNKEFISFKVCTILSSVTKCRTVPLRPSLSCQEHESSLWPVHSCRTCYLPISHHLAAIWAVRLVRRQREKEEERPHSHNFYYSILLELFYY